MTSTDETPDDPGPPARRSESDDSFVAYETEDGAFVIRDESAPDAWIRSDTVVALAVDGV